MNRRTFMAAAAAGVGCAALPVVGELPVYALEPVGMRLIVYPHPPHSHAILMSRAAIEACDESWEVATTLNGG